MDYIIGATVMLQLGSFQFGINTAAYQDLQRGTEWRWPAQDRFGKYPALQFVGPGTETISLTGLIFPEWRGGLTQIEDLRALGAQGQPQTMIDGRGNILGRWVIERVEEKQAVFAAAGVARRQEFTLQLRRIEDDTPIAVVVLPPAASSASAVASPAIPDTATTPAAKVTGLADSVLGAAKTLTGSIASAYTNVQTAVGPITEVAASAAGAVQRCATAAGEMQFAANRVLAVVGKSPINSTAIAEAKSLAGKATSMLTSAQSAGVVLRRTTTRLEGMTNASAGAIAACKSATATADSLATMCRKTASEAAKILE